VDEVLQTLAGRAYLLSMPVVLRALEGLETALATLRLVGAPTEIRRRLWSLIEVNELSKRHGDKVGEWVLQEVNDLGRLMHLDLMATAVGKGSLDFT
jgi:hypothetical protein